MRIRPIDIEVPEDDPFANDRLDRREQAEAIAAILMRIEGPFVVAIDAPWGEGKTTFLRMSRAHLRRKGVLVVAFNAWETDFCEDPFVAMTTEISLGLEVYTAEASTGSSLSKETRSEIVQALKPLWRKSRNLISWRSARKGAKFVVHLTTGIDISAPIEALSASKETLAESKVKAYTEQKGLMKSFTEALALVGTISKERTGAPLVIYIDELDRCRPTYAIELLETVKHLFSVDNIVFILGLNRAELAHSVRAVYGEQFNAERYLSRFIDTEVNLPRPDTSMIIHNAIKACGLEESLAHNTVTVRPSDYGDTLAIIKTFLDSSELSIREISQAIYHLGMVINSLPTNYHPLLPLTMVMLVLRSVDRNLYIRFIRGEATDYDVITSLFERPSFRSLKYNYNGARIEAYINLAHREILHGDLFRIEDNTTLLDKYGEMLDDITTCSSELVEYVNMLKKIIKDIRSDIYYTQHGNNLKIVISRIEIFAESFSH